MVHNACVEVYIVEWHDFNVQGFEMLFPNHEFKGMVGKKAYLLSYEKSGYNLNKRCPCVEMPIMCKFN